MSELEQMTALCSRLGANPSQAAIMAAQLLKRADQLAVERGIERTAALSYLVELVLKSRSGEANSGYPPPAAPQKPPVTGYDGSGVSGQLREPIAKKEATSDRDAVRGERD